jgi:hypothetical protein
MRIRPVTRPWRILVFALTLALLAGELALNGGVTPTAKAAEVPEDQEVTFALPSPITL